MKIEQSFKHIVLIGASVIALVPILFMIMTSVKSQDEYLYDKIGLPDSLFFENFSNVLVASPFLSWMANSAMLAVGAVCISTIVSCLGAYAIARMEFKGRDSLLAASTSLMAVPPVVMIVPLFVYANSAFTNTAGQSYVILSNSLAHGLMYMYYAYPKK